MHNLICQLIPRSSLSNHKWNEQHSYKTYQSTFDDEYTLMILCFHSNINRTKFEQFETKKKKQKTTVITHIDDFLMKIGFVISHMVTQYSHIFLVARWCRKHCANNGNISIKYLRFFHICHGQKDFNEQSLFSRKITHERAHFMVNILNFN